MLELWISERFKTVEPVKLWPGAQNIPEYTVQEGKEYLLDLTGSPTPLDHEAEIDGVRLDALRPPNQSTARWNWSPGFYAGSFSLSLQINETRTISIQVITDPNRDKLSRDQFSVMINEIMSDTMALVNLSSARIGVNKGDGSSIPPIARLEYIKSKMDELVETVNSIARNPQKRIRSDHVFTPYYAVKHIGAQNIIRSYSSKELVRANPERSRLPKILRGQLPARIRQDLKKSNLDIEEHRDLKFCLKSWKAWLLRVAGQIDKKCNENLDTRKLYKAWGKRCRGMSLQLEGLLKLSLFDEVLDQLPKNRMSSIYRRVGPYRNFYKLRREMELGITNFQGDYLQVPIARTYDLYEIWVFMRLLRAAAEVFGVKGEVLSDIFHDPNSSTTLQMPARTKMIELQNGLKLGFKIRYREFWIEASGQGSYTRTLVPDISIQLADTQEHAGSLIIIDAKYRIEENLNEAISSIHTYRDALVSGDENANIKGPIVCAAYLASPQTPKMFETFQQTKMPSRLFHPVYRKQFKFGAVTLVPGMTLREISDTLMLIYEDASP
jgi:hypothetical protein